MKKYKQIDHTADIAFVVEGKNLEELFILAAMAWKNTVLENNKITGNKEKTIILTQASREELLVTFIDQLNYLLFVKKWLFTSVAKIKIKTKGNQFFLSCHVIGTNYNHEIHNLKAEIKAVTYHQMDIKFIDGIYSTRLVFDI